MSLQDSSGTEPEFSPALAIIFSMPLAILLAAFFGPELWDIIAESLGVSLTNPTRQYRDWFMNRFGILTGIGAFLFSPLVAIFCARTTGHDKLRRMFLGVHLLVCAFVFGVIVFA